MNYYTVPRIGDGLTLETAFQPDAPADTSWVGHTDDTDYLIATPADLPLALGRAKLLPREALEAAANARGRTYEDVTSWRVG